MGLPDHPRRRRGLANLLTPRRIRRWLVAIGIGTAIGMGWFLLTSDGLQTARGGRLGGDFPAFYGAGSIARAGTIDALYTPEAQRQAQQHLLPDASGWIHFPYSPPVAVAYIPFTFLDFKAAYIVHTILMAGCCVAGVRMLARHLPAVRAYQFEAVVAALTFYPMARAIAGGQNTSLSFLCAAGAAAALASGRDLAAGVWLGAWLFKPQLSLPVTAIMVMSGRPRVLLGVALGGACWYVVGSWGAGVYWPVFWWEQGIVPFAAADLEVDRGNGISLREVSVELGVPWAGWLCSAALGLWAIAAVRRLGHPVMGMAVAAAVAALVAPHALFYDGGLAVLPLLAVSGGASAAILPYLVAAWLAGAAQTFRASLPLPPLTLLLLYAIWLTVHVSAKGSRGDRMAAREDQPT